MSRKRLTQVFPFLLPLRKWQRRNLFYLKMRFDGNRYAKEKPEEKLPYTVFDTSSLMLNKNSGFDMKYQLNKVHNLELASRTINNVIIKPNETFSFWQLIRWADRHEPYKDGLVLIDSKIVDSYGGGLCQLSNMLFWLFLHTPMTVIERHGHKVEAFPSTTEALPCGTDATVSEGWLDLKVKNQTNNIFQIVISFDDEYMHGQILSRNPVDIDYMVYNSSISYIRRDKKLYQQAYVRRLETNTKTGAKNETELYCNQCEITYELPKDIHIEEGDA